MGDSDVTNAPKILSAGEVTRLLGKNGDPRYLALFERKGEPRGATCEPSEDQLRKEQTDKAVWESVRKLFQRDSERKTAERVAQREAETKQRAKEEEQERIRKLSFEGALRGHVQNARLLAERKTSNGKKAAK
jgi:hypothetical protein